MDQRIDLLVNSIETVIVGKRKTVLQVIAALLCEGHILLEDVPGVGKTQLAAGLSRSVGGVFHRIQLTPDVMPSDITGFSVVNQKNFELEYKEGAAMCNFLLADEINRASPKVQSSLLEIMEEKQVSIDGVTHKLPRPFMVIATQNPVETYGTYHLPEAQMDRFFMRISLGYPQREDEMKILSRKSKNPANDIEKAVLQLSDIEDLQREAEKTIVSENILNYILDLVTKTRNHTACALGISPRGALALLQATKAYAFLYDRNYVVPDDVKAVFLPVVAHRLILSPQGRTEYGTAEQFLHEILEQVRIPME